MKKIAGIFLALLILSIPAVKSLFPSGGYTSHDLTHHVVRQIDIDKLLTEGQFPPRWSGDLNQGYGYPLFTFIYPTPAIFGEVFHKLGYNYVESIKVVFFISMLMSVIGMYLFLDSLFPKQKLGSFLGAIFYLYAPVRFLTTYVSASVGGALALGIIPFIFWTIVGIAKGKSWAIPAGSIFLALLMTSHNVTALMFAPVILVFSLLLIYKPKNKLLVFKNLALMAATGIGIAAFFWIPSLFEKKFIIYDQAAGKIWENQFPAFWQLIRSPWGYGLSHAGVDYPGGMSFQIGLIHILVMAVLVFTLVIFRKKKGFLVWGFFSVFTFLASIFLILNTSYALWNKLPLLYLIQFPWRFLAVSVFAASIGASLLIQILPFKKLAFFFLLALVLLANRNHLNVNQKFDPDESYYLSMKDTSASYNEHLPIWAYIPQKPSPGKLIILSGKGEVKITENKSVRVAAQINLSTDSQIRFNQFYFPGWTLTDNGNPIRFSFTGEGDNRGLPVFNLTKGLHNFEANFRDTTDRRVADVISLISLGVLGFLLFKKVRT